MRFQRFTNSIKEDGMLKTIKKLINKIAYKLKNIILKNEIEKEHIDLNEILNFKNYKRVIVFENQFGWAKIMKQRPQQMALFADESTLFLYGTTHMEIGDRKGIKHIKDNLVLIDLVIYKDLLIKSLNEFQNKYLMIYSTDYIPLEILNPYIENNFKIIYEFVDGIDEKLCGAETAKLLRERHKYIINNCNPYIVATATKLFNSIKEENKDANVALITNGADYEHFANKNMEIPEDIKTIKKDGNLIIGYYGALASWFDYNLVKKLAETNKNYQIVLLGLNYDKTLNKSGILELENVHYLGKKDYDELPKYLNCFDIATIPFIINEITLSTSPVKVFEYMAAGKPIVTTDLPECRKYESVLIGKDEQDFLNKIELAKEKIHDEDYLKLLDKEAKENAWENKFNNLITLLSNGEN